MKKYISIEQAKYIDGKENTVDFQDFILNSSHPEIQKYQDKNMFQKFNLEYGAIEWNDYDLAFPNL
ncbi:MAG: Unknown protein [uncultured Sulfurovum sp.]|uniref:DUF2442 domain-containing protein n=1 Tax=uncultured Sulfurovum sp. TaxID=269237 RepID=A0A6S6TUP2_9BACT|nr:MAG: Unknown protein [uncultured Sulfurovum sp.]